MNVVGIDPGLTGAIALVSNERLLQVWDMPVINGHVDVLGLGDVLDECEYIDTVVIEHLHAMPRGSKASWSLGYSVGAIEAVVVMASHPLVRLSPQAWKKSLGLTGKDKSASRALAIERWPKMRDEFRLVKHDGRAEAALIALAYNNIRRKS